MPLVTITRKPSIIDDVRVTGLRDMLHSAVGSTLKVKPDEVEIRIRDVGPLDLNASSFGIEIDTGKGKEGWRVEQKIELAQAVAATCAKCLPDSLLGPDHLYPYVWLRIFESAFVPIGYPDKAR